MKRIAIAALLALTIGVSVVYALPWIFQFLFQGAFSLSQYVVDVCREVL